jgi:hypothetical protein
MLEGVGWSDFEGDDKPQKSGCRTVYQGGRVCRTLRAGTVAAGAFFGVVTEGRWRQTCVWRHFKAKASHWVISIRPNLSVVQSTSIGGTTMKIAFGGHALALIGGGLLVLIAGTANGRIPDRGAILASAPSEEHGWAHTCKQSIWPQEKSERSRSSCKLMARN